VSRAHHPDRRRKEVSHLPPVEPVSCIQPQLITFTEQ
jgi:hypothetical protein